jgi:hypothetical protein
MAPGDGSEREKDKVQTRSVKSEGAATGEGKARSSNSIQIVRTDEGLRSCLQPRINSSESGVASDPADKGITVGFHQILRVFP